MPTVFVYGTLLRGMQRSSVLRHALFKGLGETRGTLLNLIDYPGLIEGTGCVTGELYEVDDTTLQSLDQIEGFDELYPDQSLYIRTTRDVISLDDGQSREAYVYLYNQESSRRDAIPGGDYRRFVARLLNSETFYIAYGSNLNPSRLEDRIGHAEASMKGYLDDFSLVFNKDNGNGSSCANLQSAPGCRVPFVAYRLPEGQDQLHLLDVFEGAPESYRRIVFPFPIGMDGKNALGHLYVANPSRIHSALPRERNTLSTFERDIKHTGLRMKYTKSLSRLKGVPSEHPDPS